MKKIGCTGCRYCCDVCPQQIPIPELFAAIDENRSFDSQEDVLKASTCLQCGLCEDACPQHISIREIIKKTGTIFNP